MTIKDFFKPIDKPALITMKSSKFAITTFVISVLVFIQALIVFIGVPETHPLASILFFLVLLIYLPEYPLGYLPQYLGFPIILPVLSIIFAFISFRKKEDKKILAIISIILVLISFSLYFTLRFLPDFKTEPVKTVEPNLCDPEPPAVCVAGRRLICENGKWSCKEIEEKIVFFSQFGKIPLRISTSENIYSESPTTLLNSGSGYYPIRSATPELSRGKTVDIEGVYYVYRNDDPRVDWAWNGNKSASSRICLNKKLDIPDGAVIQAKIFIFPTPQEYCETGEIKEYKILYTEPSLAELSKKFSPICDDLTSFLTKEHRENPLKLYTCFGNVSPEGIFGEKFTRSYFEWLPFEDKVVVEMWAVSEKTTKENKENICKLERKGAIVLNLVSEKIEEIYITQAEEICEIIN